MTKRPRAVITGLGAVCASGSSPEAIARAVREGRSGIGPLTRWDPAGWAVKRAGEIREVDDRTLVPDRKLHKMVSRLDLLGIHAADRAIEASGLAAYRASLDPASALAFNDRSGILTGSGGGSYRFNDDFHPLLTEADGSMKRFGEEHASIVNPMWLLRILPNNVLCHVGITHQFKGTNACITNQCTGGILAAAEGAAALRSGESDRVLAVGYDSPVEPELVFHYDRLGLASSDELRPFDAGRTGTILGEGSAAIVLEHADAADRRGAPILGEILGSGSVTEGSGIVEIRPDGDGVFRAMSRALLDAGLEPADIGMIVAHANGTPLSDATEAMAIRRLFGNDPPPVTAFKWSYGHTLAACGMLDLVTTIHSLRAGVVPGIPTLRTLDPALAPFPVSASGRPPRNDTALVICRGFGGMNAAIVVRAPLTPGE
ncbi:MAG TPA: beta-ketoacyl synthase N-terminal-like domain-containing protein [Candidatus Eisenbacteria bacterium]